MGDIRLPKGTIVQTEYGAGEILRKNPLSYTLLVWSDDIQHWQSGKGLHHEVCLADEEQRAAFLARKQEKDPNAIDWLELMRACVDARSMCQFKRYQLDLFSMSAVVQLYDAMKPSVQADFKARTKNNPVAMIELTWKIVKQHK